MPYFLLATVAMSVAVPDSDPFRHPGRQLAAYALALPLVTATALLLPPVRTLESAAARVLCTAPEAEPVPAPADSWAARRRTAAWFTLHLGLGALVSGASLAIPPAAAVLVTLPLSPGLRKLDWGWYGDTAGAALWTAPAAGAALLAALAAAVWGAGALLDRCAPALLGPTPADRLAAAEARAAALAARDRLARELHDSVGHALSAVALQAGAARTVLDSDPAFVRRALAAIEETARRTTGELDAVLGMLRDGEEPSRAPAGPTLAGLDGLLETTRAGGVPVALTASGPAAEILGTLPVLLSREAYRIVQEGLANALRHAGRVPVAVSLALDGPDRPGGPDGSGGSGRPDDRKLVITVENPALPEDGPRRPRRGGGTGLRGIGERAAALGGSAEAGAYDGRWRLTVRLPLRDNR
ncbi:sensor histidine kinase [Streptomyces glaucosporus]